MREHIKQNFGTYMLCIGLFFAACAAFAIATAMDVTYWLGIAKDDMSRLEFAGGAVVFRVTAFLFAAVAAWQFKRGTFGSIALGAVSCALVIGFASLGVTSVIGFNARERIEPYKQAKAYETAQIAAFEEAKARQIKLEDAEIARKHAAQDAQIGFLRDQARVAKGPQSRQVTYDAMAPLTGFSTEVVPTQAVIAPPKIAAASDPGAEAIQARFPQYTVEDIQLAIALAWGIGPFIAEMFCLGFAVGMWPKYQPPARTALADGGTVIAPVADAQTIELSAANIIHPPQFAARPAQASIVEEPVEEPVQGELLSEVDAHMTALDQVAEFWEERTRPAKAAMITATAMYKAYVAWCESAHPQRTPLSQKMFGTVSTRICERTKFNGNNNYVGRAIIGATEGELLMAA